MAKGEAPRMTPKVVCERECRSEVGDSEPRGLLIAGPLQRQVAGDADAVGQQFVDGSSLHPPRPIEMLTAVRM